MSNLRIGFIGLDTSHVSAFARFLNDPNDPNYKPGSPVTCAWPGGSPDFKASIDRVGGFTQELRESFGVEILDTPEAVAEACDLIFITAVDGRTHPDLFLRVAKAGKPVFIDKPFALSVTEAREMIALAAAEGITLMSCSSLRFSEELLAAVKAGRDEILGCDLYGPMSEEATQPGLFWYGCHTVEMLVSVMGTGCREVRCLKTDGHDVVTATWTGGRVATVHGLRGGHWKFGAVIHRTDGPIFVDGSAGRPPYLCLLDAILESLPNGRSAVPPEEMLEVVSIIAAANESRLNNGRPVTLPS